MRSSFGIAGHACSFCPSGGGSKQPATLADCSECTARASGTSLAAGLSSRFGAQAFTDKMLTTPAGFIGVDGAFRLLSDGTNQRALAVYQIERGQLGVLAPAPKNFAAGF
jgi:hypothetical protein